MTPEEENLETQPQAEQPQPIRSPELQDVLDQAESQPEDEPVEETDEQSGEPDSATGARPEEQLQAILAQAKNSRFSPPDEDRAVSLLTQTLAGGPKALPATVEALLSLPWSAAVKAVSEAWPMVKPAGRTRLLAALAKVDGDASRRIRLSLARGLHAQDPAAALKLISGVAEAMGGAQGGSTTKDRQTFANVMLGKARPWLMNISMAEMKPAEALKLIVPALESCHQAPIFTQIWVLRWICDAEKFDALSPEHIQSIGKSINRWQLRWLKELRKIIPKLPDSLEAALAQTASPRVVQAAEELSVAIEVEEQEPERPAEEPAGEEEHDTEEISAGPEDEDRHSGGRGARLSRADRRSSRERSQPAQFDVTRSLRDLEAYIARLRSELQQAQAAARKREPDRPRGRLQAASGEELDELQRHNRQLDEQNLELRSRIEELLADHEDRAATLGITDSLDQFKTYLGLKLKEDFADYSAISRESLNEVVRRHAHEILGRIFSILRAEGVRFDQEK